MAVNKENVVGNLIYWWQAFTTPSCWMQNESYNKYWDKELNRLLETDTFKNITTHEATIGGYTVWTANHPYASFTICDRYRPSRRTIFKAWDKLTKAHFESTKSSVL